MNKLTLEKCNIFGNIIVGCWVCLNCRYKIFPRLLEKEFKNNVIKRMNDKFVCPCCKELMIYDECE